MSHGLKWTAEPAYNLISSRLLWVWVSCGATREFHGEPQALATEIWGKICPPSDQEAIV